jgi:hypothetical protein
MPETRVGFLLNSLPELQALNRELKQLAVLQTAVTEILPNDLIASTRVSVMKAGTVTLSATNGAAAAKLKQLSPRILNALRKHEYEITGIRVEVQLRTRDNSLPPKQISLSSSASDAIEVLSKQLGNSPLKTALDRLSRRGKDRS